jgi:chorismate dehydratase
MTARTVFPRLFPVPEWRWPAITLDAHPAFARLAAGPMRRLRLSAISYLNTAPLMWDFEHADAGADFDIEYTLPSSCAAALAAGTADIGIIPAFAYAGIPGLVILPDVAIASRGAVRSILLVCKVPLERVRTVALDTSSMTSVALTRVLFEKFWGSGREFRAMAPDLDRMLTACDAALIIGDPALRIERSRYITLDLAEEWRRLTGKPFVFAFWAVRREALAQMRRGLDLAQVFQQSRDHGLQPAALAQIARHWAPRTGLSEAAVTQYLKENIHYSLDQECLGGMELFFRLAAECGVLASTPELFFWEAAAVEQGRAHRP